MYKIITALHLATYSSLPCTPLHGLRHGLRQSLCQAVVLMRTEWTAADATQPLACARNTDSSQPVSTYSLSI